MEPVLKLDRLSYEVDSRRILDGVSFQLGRAESLAVSGPSGSGKSTLLSCILGLQRPSGGTITVAGSLITSLSSRKAARLRSEKIGMVFQFGELLPELSPLENVAIAGLLNGFPKKNAFSRAAELLRELGISPDLKLTGALSGGERQRVAVARALINEPSLILADEPTGALDTFNKESVSELLYSLPEKWGCGLIVVTHDVEVSAHAQRKMRLRDGRLTEDIPQNAGACR
ncbi:ABC transporter ATP-binding protein [Streptomyces sp. NPDC006235]|uniref:ABC transporter ATP-binding protein n=1 Tax=Streptomyces sp. NPDC006235 TaxID=3156736 RepID=UPI0033B7375A